MNEFNLLVLHIAAIVLIISLIVVGIILYYSIRDGKFPPFDTSCPSFYQLDSSGNTCTLDGAYNPYHNIDDYPSKANNIKSGCNTVPLTKFYTSGSTPEDILCEKTKWANECKIYWDGVTNNPNSCVKKQNSLFLNN